MSPQISGLLIDIDGVLITENQKIAGAIETIHFLYQRHIPFLLVTNTTRRTRLSIWNQLKRLGFPIHETQIFTAPGAAVNWLKSKNIRTIYLLLSGSAVKEFKDFKLTSANPEYVVIGDIGQELTFDKLNTAFRLIMKGAKILALQKNRYWRTQQGLTIDAGAIVAALEYATHTRALVVGKPRKEFFLQAAEMLKLAPRSLAIIGDDMETDIKGGQQAGLLGIAVKTGKFRPDTLEKNKIKPDVILNSIRDLPAYITEIHGG